MELFDIGMQSLISRLFHMTVKPTADYYQDLFLKKKKYV